MKLKNKKTGEIIEFDAILPVKDVSGDSVAHLEYNSLTEFNEEWEDYEEPKTHWNITQFGDAIYGVDEYSAETVDEMKQIGNYFDTKEEAELAVEKLKAWKRLKDKGIRFKCCDDYHIDYELTGKCAWTDETEADLDLLFGGEE